MEELVAESLQLQKFKDAITDAAKVRSYFAAHRSDFDRVTVMRLEGLTRRSARGVADRWRRRGVCPVFDRHKAPLQSPTGRLDTSFACDLPPELAAEPVNAVVGPVSGGNTLWVGQVLGRSAARFDGSTRERIGRRLFEAWLADKRSTASIRWHWV